MSVGPKTMARFGMCMRLNSLYFVTLQQDTINIMTYNTLFCMVMEPLTLREDKSCLKTSVQENIWI
jgi:hypothetical protein